MVTRLLDVERNTDSTIVQSRRTSAFRAIRVRTKEPPPICAYEF
jgi:hypothetical protein